VKLTQTTHDLNIYVDSDWAGCVETRKSTTGFSITFLGATISYASRTQATIALSSAEAELYAINTGAAEALHFQNLLTDFLNSNKANIKIHTDSSSGKSIATRIGTGKKTKHVELKHLFLQPLVALNHLRIIKIHTTMTIRQISSQSTFQQKHCNVISQVFVQSNTIHTQASEEATNNVSQNSYSKQ